MKFLAKYVFWLQVSVDHREKDLRNVSVVNEDTWVGSAYIRSALVYTWDKSTNHFIVNDNSRN